VRFRGHRRAGGAFISPEAALYQTTPLGYTSGEMDVDLLRSELRPAHPQLSRKQGQALLHVAIDFRLWLIKSVA
jgi:hypothetical protein